jgi:hypothetical protein
MFLAIDRVTKFVHVGFFDTNTKMARSQQPCHRPPFWGEPGGGGAPGGPSAELPTTVAGWGRCVAAIA